MGFDESDFLKISGIQHFDFCRRQWALIHIEEQWKENAKTVGGEIFHERAHESGLTEKRGELLIVRGLKVFSSELGVSGECDVVEFRKNEKCGAYLQGYDCKWLPAPVEYKSGTAKSSDADRLQLCLQAMCLEEMLGCEIEQGYLFYGQNRRRETVSLDEALRLKVRKYLQEMHEYMKRGYTPKVKPGKSCNGCSLKDICLPILCKEQSVKKYISAAIGEEGIK